MLSLRDFTHFARQAGFSIMKRAGFPDRKPALVVNYW
ncbi:hypothetical protein [uncultured Desulfobacter sp.]|nr:hypothetical protein [uncultured Desulfobacter sp.]